MMTMLSSLWQGKRCGKAYPPLLCPNLQPILFVFQGADKLIIFMPGANVDTEFYLPTIAAIQARKTRWRCGP